MARVVVSADYDAPPDRVWAVLEPVEDHVEWMADAEAIRFVTEQTRGVGTAFECDTRVGPLRVTDRLRITEWEPGRRMGVRHEGLVTGTGAFTLEPLDGGRRTRFTWEEELIAPWWLGGRLTARVAGATVMRAIWRRNLNRLRPLVERAP